MVRAVQQWNQLPGGLVRCTCLRGLQAKAGQPSVRGCTNSGLLPLSPRELDQIAYKVYIQFTHSKGRFWPCYLPTHEELKQATFSYGRVFWTQKNVSLCHSFLSVLRVTGRHSSATLMLAVQSQVCMLIETCFITSLLTITVLGLVCVNTTSSANVPPPVRKPQ